MSYFKSALLNLSYTKFGAKMKVLKLGPKRPHLGNFGLELENTIVIIEISALEFYFLPWDRKMSCYGILGVEFVNNIVIF